MTSQSSYHISYLFDVLSIYLFTTKPMPMSERDRRVSGTRDSLHTNGPRDELNH